MGDMASLYSWGLLVPLCPWSVGADEAMHPINKHPLINIFMYLFFQVASYYIALPGLECNVKNRLIFNSTALPPQVLD